MADRKETNPFSSEDSNPPHLPPTAYQPNPFPYNPTEGNPWAASNAYQQQPAYQGHAYGHGINNSSDNETQNSQQYLAMPSPSTYKTASNDSSYDFPNTYNNTSTYNPNVAYNPNAYNTNTSSEFNAYQNSQLDNGNGNKEEYDDNTTELDNSSVVNPGIETHDPDKLKISSQMLETPKSAPNIWRLFSRFVQFLASAGAFALMVAAQPATKVKTPVGVNKTAVIFVYIVSVVSVIYSFGHLIFYCVRRWGHKNKAPRWLLILVDAILGASFGTIMVFLIKDFSCKPGELNGWCDFYNSSIFFTVLAFVTYAVSFFWDIVGGFKRS